MMHDRILEWFLNRLPEWTFEAMFRIFGWDDEDGIG